MRCSGAGSCQSKAVESLERGANLVDQSGGCPLPQTFEARAEGRCAPLLYGCGDSAPAGKGGLRRRFRGMWR